MGRKINLITHAEIENSSTFLIREQIANRAELRRLRKIPAVGLRGPDDLTDSGDELFCPGGLQLEKEDGFMIVWELRQWNPEMNGAPDKAERSQGWQHLVAAGFRVAYMGELARIMGWPYSEGEGGSAGRQ